VGRHPVPPPAPRGDGVAGEAAELPGERLGQRPVLKADPFEGGPGVVGDGDEAAPHLLGERPDEGGDDLLPQARHLPLERRRVDLVEDRQRDVDGDAIGIRAGIELVGQAQLEGPVPPHVGVGVGVEGAAGRVDEQIPGEAEQVGALDPLPFPPGVEGAGRRDLAPDPLVVEVDQDLVVDEDVGAPHPFRQ